MIYCFPISGHTRNFVSNKSLKIKSEHNLIFVILCENSIFYLQRSNIHRIIMYLLSPMKKNRFVTTILILLFAVIFTINGVFSLPLYVWSFLRIFFTFKTLAFYLYYSKRSYVVPSF